MINNNSYCVIMAGGLGKRFWPLSNRQTPKQFCDILHTGKSFLQQTFERVRNVFSVDHIFVVIGSNYEKITREQLPEIPIENVLKEPLGKNTAPCIAYAAYRIAQINPKAVMVVVPSDHYIGNDDLYTDSIVQCISYVESNYGLLTIGIKPFFPETGYGYIQVKDDLKMAQISKVKAFTEKPNKELANKFLASGDFLWNTGIFIWRIEDIIEEFRKYLPDLSLLFEKEYKNVDERGLDDAAIVRIYSQSPNISIDFGIMEKSLNVYVMQCDFGWSDVGTWHSFYELAEKDSDGNVNSQSNVYLLDSQKCIVCTSSMKKVVIEGVDNCIIAEKDNVLMICRRDCEDKIQYFSDLLRYKTLDNN